MRARSQARVLSGQASRLKHWCSERPTAASGLTVAHLPDLVPGPYRRAAVGVASADHLYTKQQIVAWLASQSITARADIPEDGLGQPPESVWDSREGVWSCPMNRGPSASSLRVITAGSQDGNPDHRFTFQSSPRSPSRSGVPRPTTQHDAGTDEHAAVPGRRATRRACAPIPRLRPRRPFRLSLLLHSGQGTWAKPAATGMSDPRARPYTCGDLGELRDAGKARATVGATVGATIGATDVAPGVEPPSGR